MNRARIFLRSALASAAATLALLAGPSVAGCAGVQRPDPLAVASTLNNALAASIDAETRRHEDQLERAIIAGVAACPDSPLQQLLACHRQAAVAALELAAPEHRQLVEVAMLQRRVARGLQAAQACRREGLGCEARELSDVESTLATARALLTKVGGAPAPDGGAL